MGEKADTGGIKPGILAAADAVEFFTSEQCYIRELSNSDRDPQVSIAQVRVRPGITTRWHRLVGIAERYCILSGNGEVQIGERPAQAVAAGDLVIIPAGCRQRIRNPGADDLVFLAICTPRFRIECYQELT